MEHEQLLKKANEEEKFAKLEKFPTSPPGPGNGEWQQSQETEAASSAE